MQESCTKNAQSRIDIGSVELRNCSVLAPMSGVTDVPFRRLAWEFGAGMVVSEMVASEALTTGQQEMRLKAETAGLPTHIVQLAGRQAKWMGEAARMAEQAGASVIDINMGCPSKRVTNGYSGSALMRDLDHAESLIEAVLKATDLPVTLKMRLGWDEQTINAPELAERAERAGTKMITVHGRTRNQFYKGQANWRSVRLVRERISIPLVVNGDIVDSETAQRAMQLSGADGVMLGRACYGAPWLPGQVGAALSGRRGIPTPTGHRLAELIIGHYESMLSFYGVDLGIRNARKHLDWYCARLVSGPNLMEARRQLLTSRQPSEVIATILALFDVDEPSKEAA